MDYSLSRRYEIVVKLLQQRLEPQAHMNHLIEFCLQRGSQKPLDRLRTLDYAAELAQMTRWLTDIFTQNPPPDDVLAFWFGIFNPVRDGQATTDFYIIGSMAYEPHTYKPPQMYAHSGIMHQLFQTVDSSPEEYVLCLGYTGLVVRHLCEQVAPQLWLGKALARPVAVGFDSGDWLLIGNIHPSGYDRIVRAYFEGNPWIDVT